MQKLGTMWIGLLIVSFTLVLGITQACTTVIPKTTEPIQPTLLTIKTTPLPTTSISTSIVRPVEYYVSLDGKDTNSGTFAEPWRTIQYAVDHVIAGDTLYIMQGIYFENVDVKQTGSQEKPIILTSYKSDQVIIDGGIKPAITVESTSTYWIVKGLTLASVAERTINLHSSYWNFQDNHIKGMVYLYGSFNTIEKNNIDGSDYTGSGNGLMDDSEMSHHNTFKGNLIHHFKDRGIWTQWRTHDNLIEGNTIEDIYSERGICIDTDGASNVEWRHVIRGNFIHDCGQTGIELENTYESIVENNIVYNTGLEGIQIISYEGCEVGGENKQYGNTDGKADCRGSLTNNIVRQNLIYKTGRVGGIVSYSAGGVQVFNNTIYGGDGVGLFLKDGVDFSPGWILEGNIFVGNARAEISLVDIASLVKDDYNLFYHALPGTVYEVRSGPLYLTTFQYRAMTNNGKHSIQADPKFVNPASHDFHLQTGSPAIDAGVDVGLKYDIEGKPRPQDKGYDLGVYEFGTENALPQ